VTPEELAVYRTVIRPQVRTGDAWIFFGSGVLSAVIRLFSAGPSHIAVVRQAAHQNSGGPTIIESTISQGTVNGTVVSRDGVQTNDMDARITEYPGSVAWLPLSDESRRVFNEFEFFKFCGECQDHVRYDKMGLVEFLIREVPVLGVRVAQTEDLTEMVCSALAVALWQKSGLVAHVNWTKQSPEDAESLRIFSRFVPVAGKPPQSKYFNTL
jgi:hypothetical protein